MKRNRLAVIRTGLVLLIGFFALAVNQPASADDHHHFKYNHSYYDGHGRHHHLYPTSLPERYGTNWESKQRLINSRVPREGSWAVAESHDGKGRLLYVSDVRHDEGMIRIKFRDSENGDWKIKAKGRHLEDIERDLRIHGYHQP